MQTFYFDIVDLLYPLEYLLQCTWFVGLIGINEIDRWFKIIKIMQITPIPRIKTSRQE